jgi:SAM-dependent methyltransferase
VTADARLSRRALLGLGLRGRAEPEQPYAAEPPVAERGAAGDPRVATEPWLVDVALRSEAVSPLVAAAELGAGQDVLDVGADDGPAARAAAAAGARVTAVGAAQTAALPFAAGGVDRVLSLFDVTYADDPRRTMDEVERVLRPGGVIAVAAWASAGLMGRLLRLASAGRTARPARWGRYEGAQLLFSRFPDFELREHRLRWAFDDLAAAAEAVAAPPAVAEAVETELRGHGREEDGRFVVDVAYVVIAARKPEWA